jgi:hypothetical protein
MCWRLLYVCRREGDEREGDEREGDEREGERDVVRE